MGKMSLQGSQVQHAIIVILDAVRLCDWVFSEDVKDLVTNCLIWFWIQSGSGSRVLT
jgi:hypothetical protein